MSNEFTDELWPSIPGEVRKTVAGTPYLTSPGVALISQPSTYLHLACEEFLGGFDEDLDFMQYLNDLVVPLPEAEAVVKFAGQLCYASFGPNRTMNEDASKYLDNIKSSGHGSVMEHANFSFLIYGADRSFTHELVRHRAGAAYSQISQRYVDGKVLRFVEREEFQGDPDLHRLFEQRIDSAVADYEYVAKRLLELQATSEILSADSKRDARKKVNQAARALLPNETEAPIIMTANVRSWRHVVEMRASKHADTQIRRVGVMLFKCLSTVAPMLFEDYSLLTLPDGTQAVETKYRKV